MGNDIVVGLGSVNGSAGKGSENGSVKGLVTGATDGVGVGVGVEEKVGCGVDDGVGGSVADGGGEPIVKPVFGHSSPPGDGFDAVVGAVVLTCDNSVPCRPDSVF